MPKRFTQRLAFTLVELLSVVVILGVLMAILIPTFLNSRSDAQDASAGAQVTTAFHRAKAYWVDKERFPTAGEIVSRLSADEPGLTPVEAASLDTASAPSGGQVSVYSDSAQQVAFTTLSDSGRVIYLVEDNGQIRVNFPLPGAGVIIEGEGAPPPAPVAPQNTEPPTISGTETEGETLTGTNGTWSGDEPISFAYRWERAAMTAGPWNTISSATSTTYTLTSTDANAYVRICVTATNGAGSDEACSDPTGQIQQLLPTVSGGTLTSDATYYYRTFTSNGTLAVSGSSLTVDLLVVGGGGGGGVAYGGGGGAGGVLTPTSVALAPATYPAVIGAGGAGAYLDTNTGVNVAGVSGGNTTFGGYTAFGGGRGGSDFSCALAAESGGSGGGGSGDVYTTCGAGQSGTPGQGNKGGDSRDIYPQIGGGGGGAGGAGQDNADSGYAAAAGGAGVTVFGRSVGGGGGASAYDELSSPNNATHGGGSGGYFERDGQSGAANTGGGGGANGRFSTSAGAGGSGIVVVRYLRSAVGG